MKATCKYCNETKDVCLFIKDKKPFRCRKCYNKLYGNGQFDDIAYLKKHGWVEDKSIQRRKPRYSELEAKAAETDKYKALYENSQSQVETLRSALNLIKKDLEVNIRVISNLLSDPADESYEKFIKEELPSIVKDITELVKEIVEDEQD